MRDSLNVSICKASVSIRAAASSYGRKTDWKWNGNDRDGDGDGGGDGDGDGDGHGVSTCIALSVLIWYTAECALSSSPALTVHIWSSGSSNALSMGAILW